MIGFTESELQQLTELKNELLNHPRDYFFKGWNDFSEFKETFVSMSSLQWHYLSSGLNLIIEFFKTLGQALYSLVTLQFSIAGEQFCSATKAALAAITKLSLDLALLVLHTARLLSLFIANFFPELIFLATAATITITLFASGYLVLSFVSYLMACGVIGCYMVHLDAKSKDCEQKKIWLELKEYYIREKEVYEELAFIIDDVRDSMNQQNQGGASRRLQLETIRKRRQEICGNRYMLFTENPVIQNMPCSEAVEHKEVAEQLFNAFSTYPVFDDHNAKESGYIADAHRELEEHHTNTKLLFEQYLKRTQIEESRLNKDVRDLLSPSC